MARAKAASKKKTRSRKKKGTFSVDFEGVESGGGRPVPDGQYNAMITKMYNETRNVGEHFIEDYIVLAHREMVKARVRADELTT